MTSFCKRFDAICIVYTNFHKAQGITTSGLIVSVTSVYWCNRIAAAVDPICYNAVSNGNKVVAYCRYEVRWKKCLSNKGELKKMHSVMKMLEM